MSLRTIVPIIAMTVAAATMGFTCLEENDNSPHETDALLGAAPASPPTLRALAQPGHGEFADDPFVQVLRDDQPTTPAVAQTRNTYVSVQVNVDAAGDNIVGDAANEPSIAVDPTSPNRMAIGWRQFDTIASDFRQAGWGYATDGGRSWTFPGVIEPGVFRSDPVLDTDADGNFYYNSLTNEGGYQCKVFKSIDGGMSWDAGVYAFGGDKAWMAIDRTGGMGHGNIYHAWDYAGCCGDDWFSRSTDGGQTFDTPVPVPGQPIWGVTAVGPDGEVYIAGRRESTGSEFIVAKSSTVQDPLNPLAFDFAQPVDLGGSLLYNLGYGPNPGGLLGHVWVAVDHSVGPTRGNVYVLASVEPPGADPLDVHFIRSTDGGVTWSIPIRINDDAAGTNAWQWFGTLSVAPNGRIDVIWNDTRDDPGGYDSELYYSYSDDAGLTWSANEPISPPFDPHLGWPQQDKLGDYYDMVSDKVGAHLAYAATFNGEQDVYYLRIGEYDCNDNGIGDLTDIADGTSQDVNADGIPDECDLPPDCDTGGPYVAECQGNTTAVALDGTGSSDPEHHPLVFMWATDCPGASLDDPASPTPALTVDTAPGCAVDCTVTLTLTDDLGAQTTCAAPVSIADTTAPSIDACPPTTTVECDGTGNVADLNAWLAAFQASDICGEVTLSNDFTGLSDDCGATGSATVTFTATDECGLSFSCTSAFTIEDTTRPMITCPPDVTVTCGESTDPADTGMAAATDLCDDDPAYPAITYSDVETPTTCPADPVQYTIARTWRATDECGNHSECIQTIIVLKLAHSGLIIKQGACPAPLNRSSHGVLPVVLPGEGDFDVARIDLSTVLLSRADCIGGAAVPNDGPPGPPILFQDLNHPYDGPGPCSCSVNQSSDGLTDLVMKFRTDDLVSALELDSLPPGTVVEVVLSGTLDDGCEFTAHDCVRIVGRGGGP